MEEKANTIHFEEVLDTEINDIWNLLFPQIIEQKERLQKREQPKQSKPRRYLKFLTM